MVLHDVSDDTDFIEIPTSTLSSEGLLEGHLHVIDMVSVPGSTQEGIAESQNQNILHHLFAKVVIDSIELLFRPVWLQSFLKGS